MRVPRFYPLALMVLAALVVGAGCSRVPPPATATRSPTSPRGSDEFREWVRRHQIDPRRSLADLRRELDQQGKGGRRDFDRQSQSRVGYADIRDELEVLMAAHGPGATVADATGDKPGGR